jgi:hypothetical protein
LSKKKYFPIIPKKDVCKKILEKGFGKLDSREML